MAGNSVSRASLGTDDDEMQIKETIYAYFTLRYDALKANKSYVDYSPVIEDLDKCSTDWLQMERIFGHCGISFIVFMKLQS